MKFYVIYRDIDLKGGSPCTVCMPEMRFPLEGEGLVNQGNHCYANAVIQMLLTATGLFHDSETLRKIKNDRKILDDEHLEQYMMFLQPPLTEPTKVPTFKTFKDYYSAIDTFFYETQIDDMWDEEVFNLILSLRDTTSKQQCILKFTKGAGYADQQDAQEFLLYLLNASLPFSFLRPHYRFTEDYEQFKQPDCTEIFSTKSDTHPMLELIPITSLSLQGLLNSMMSECQTIDNHNDIKSRKIILNNLQKYLFIHLRIFTGDGSHTTRIETPTVIDNFITIHDDVYEVIAVVYHSGIYEGNMGKAITKSTIHTSGHYTCKAKRSELDGTTSIYYYDDIDPPKKFDDFTPPPEAKFVPYLVLCERVSS